MLFLDEAKDPEESENIENTDPIKESDEKPLGEEIKLQKELEENEKDNVVQDKLVVEEEEKAKTVEEKAKIVEVKRNPESKNPLPTVSNRYEALQVNLSPPLAYFWKSYSKSSVWTLSMVAVFTIFFSKILLPVFTDQVTAIFFNYLF